VITDVNVNLSRWPFRRLSCDEPAALVAKLRKSGVRQAWTGSFDGAFHKDLAAVNARLTADCREYGGAILLPFGSVNPNLPDWREDLRRCCEQHKMEGIRLHPNYHGYKLDDSSFRELLQLAAARNLIVQLALCMEDERTQHPLMRVPPVDLGPLADAIVSEPKLKLVILNCYPQLAVEKLRPPSTAGQVFFDLAMIEHTGGILRLREQVSQERVLFGSHFPLFYFESALLKIQEAGLTGAEQAAIYDGNARRLLGK
jgi:predicted TIM-barrel fold metal-dependent hydrolase